MLHPVTEGPYEGPYFRDEDECIALPERYDATLKLHIDCCPDTSTAWAYATAHVFITPRVAQCWLERHAISEVTSPDKQNEFVQVMLRGMWHGNSDHPIEFNFGTICNGHHRLNAIVQSNMSYTMLVKFCRQRRSPMPH